MMFGAFGAGGDGELSGADLLGEKIYVAKGVCGRKSFGHAECGTLPARQGCIDWFNSSQILETAGSDSQMRPSSL